MRIALIVIPVAVAALAARAGEPTITEMLTEATKMSARSDPETGRPGDPVAGLEDSAFVRQMKARLPRELFVLDKAMESRGDNNGRGWLYFDIQRYREALEHFLRETRGRGWRLENGFVHGDLAKLHMMMGHDRAAYDAADEFKRRIGDPRLMGHHERLERWVKAFPEKKAEVDKLLEKAGADPKDAKSRWRLLDLYRYDYPRRLDEFIGLMQFRDLYPEDREVTRGECEWRLMAVMWRFGIRDEALKLAEEFRKKYPEHGETKSGEAAWRLGGYREHFKQYAGALECYREVKDKFPKHRSHNERRDQPTAIDEAVFRTTRALEGRR